MGVTDNEDGVAAAAAADHLHGDGGECDVPHDPHEAHQRRPGPARRHPRVRLHICQPPCSIPR